MFAFLLLVVIVLFVYFLPANIAIIRKNPAAPGIFILNFVFGWTFLGWIVALIWALNGRTPAAVTVTINTGDSTYTSRP